MEQRRTRNNYNDRPSQRNNDRYARDDYPTERNSRREYNDYDDRPRRRREEYDDRGYPPRHKPSKTPLILLIIAGVAALGIGASLLFKKKDAQILSVTPNIITTSRPTEECGKVGTTTYVKNQKDGTEGTLIGGATGAVAGGIIGNQIKQGGGGTAVGALVGGATGALVGNQVQKANQPDYIAKKGTKTQCRTVYRKHQTQNGYNVTYMYDDTTATIATQNALAVGSKIPFNQLQAMAIQPNNN